MGASGDQRCWQLHKFDPILWILEHALRLLSYLVSSTVTVHCDCDIWFVQVLKSERETDAHWDLSTDDTVTSVEVVLLSVKMHGSSSSFG